MELWTAERIWQEVAMSNIDAHKELVFVDDLKKKISELRFDADIAGLQDTEIVLQALERALKLR